MQTTSLIPYFRCVLPTLAERHQAVIKALHGSDMTNSELSHILGWEINRVTPRVKELREKGLVEEKTRRRCNHTGRTAIVWGLRRFGNIDKF